MSGIGAVLIGSVVLWSQTKRKTKSKGEVIIKRLRNHPEWWRPFYNRFGHLISSTHLYLQRPEKKRSTDSHRLSQATFNCHLIVMLTFNISPTKQIKQLHIFLQVYNGLREHICRYVYNHWHSLPSTGRVFMCWVWSQRPGRVVKCWSSMVGMPSDTVAGRCGLSLQKRSMHSWPLNCPQCQAHSVWTLNPPARATTARASLNQVRRTHIKSLFK